MLLKNFLLGFSLNAGYHSENIPLVCSLFPLQNITSKMFTAAKSLRRIVQVTAHLQRFQSVQRSADAGAYRLLSHSAFSIPTSSLLGRSFCSSASGESISNGDKVTILYSVKVQDGSVKSLEFDPKDDPVSFIAGSDAVLPALNENILTMKVGETKEFTCGPEKCYGVVDEKAFANVPLSNLPESVEKGTWLSVGESRKAVVVSIDKEKEEARINFNHPLAGSSLIFKVKCLDKIPAEELGLKVETLVEGRVILSKRSVLF